MRLNPALARRTRLAAASHTSLARIDRHPLALRGAVLELRRRLRLLSRRHGQQLDPTHIGALYITVRRIASEAAASGLSAHRTLAVRALEQLDPMLTAGYVPNRIVQVMYEWTGLLLSCLAKPTNTRAVARLVRHLGDSRWEHPLSIAEREELLSALLIEPVVGEI